MDKLTIEPYDTRRTEPVRRLPVVWQRTYDDTALNRAAIEALRREIVAAQQARRALPKPTEGEARAAIERINAHNERVTLTRLETRTAAAFGLLVPRWIVWVVRWVTGGRR